MRRWIAILWHASFLLLAGGLYFFFVLPRWFELLGDWSTTLGTAMRIVCGLLIALAALPVLLTWRRTRKPEYGTPQLALTLRLASIVLHVLAGVLIVVTAVSEIWLNLDDVGQWLFGVYGAAAAVALLGAFAFYLAYAAELPPPPPKPLKPKSQTGRRGRGRKSAAADATTAGDVDEAAVTPEPDEADEPVEAGASDGTDEAVESTDDDEVITVTDGNAQLAGTDIKSEENDSEENGKLRNRRPAGKSSSRLFRRSRGGVIVDD